MSSNSETTSNGKQVRKIESLIPLDLKRPRVPTPVAKRTNQKKAPTTLKTTNNLRFIPVRTEPRRNDDKNQLNAFASNVLSNSINNNSTSSSSSSSSQSSSSGWRKNESELDRNVRLTNQRFANHLHKEASDQDRKLEEEDLFFAEITEEEEDSKDTRLSAITDDSGQIVDHHNDYVGYQDNDDFGKNVNDVLVVGKAVPDELDLKNKLELLPQDYKRMNRRYPFYKERKRKTSMLRVASYLTKKEDLEFRLMKVEYTVQSDKNVGPIIQMIGHSRGKNTASVRLDVHGVKPYFFVKKPSNWNEYHVRQFCERLEQFVKDNLDYKAKNFSGFNKIHEAFLPRLLLGHKIVKGTEMKGYDFDMGLEMIQLTVAYPGLVPEFRKKVEDYQNNKLFETLEHLKLDQFCEVTYESDLPFTSRFMIDNGINGEDWFRVKASDYQVLNYQRPMFGEEAALMCPVDVHMSCNFRSIHQISDEELEVEPPDLDWFDEYEIYFERAKEMMDEIKGSCPNILLACCSAPVVNRMDGNSIDNTTPITTNSSDEDEEEEEEQLKNKKQKTQATEQKKDKGKEEEEENKFRTEDDSKNENSSPMELEHVENKQPEVGIKKNASNARNNVDSNAPIPDAPKVFKPSSSTTSFKKSTNNSTTTTITKTTGDKKKRKRKPSSQKIKVPKKLDRSATGKIILCYDIEVAGKKGIIPHDGTDPVIDIGVTVESQYRLDDMKRYCFVLKSCPKSILHKGQNIKVYSYEREEELLIDFQRFIQIIDPDIISNYNGENFDLPYLIRRKEYLLEQLSVRRLHASELYQELSKFEHWTRDYKRAIHFKENTCTTMARGTVTSKESSYFGRVQLDMLLYIRANYQLRSNALGDVGEEFLKISKEEMDYEKIPDHFKTMKGRIKLAIYCVHDSYMVSALIRDRDALTYIEGMAKNNHMTIEDILKRGQTAKCKCNIYYETFRIEPRIFIPTRTEKERKAQGQIHYSGAFVFPPIRGLHDQPISTFDFTSLYPSIMMDHNMCNSTKIGIWSPELQKTLDAMGFVEGIHYKKIESTGVCYTMPSVRKGIFPAILENLLALRGKAKKSMAIYEKLVELCKHAPDSLLKNYNAEYSSKYGQKIGETTWKARFDGSEDMSPENLERLRKEFVPFIPMSELIYKVNLPNTSEHGKSFVLCSSDWFKYQNYAKQRFSYYNIQQTAVKLIMNSMYGALGAAISFLYDPDIAASVTGEGRDMITEVNENVVKHLKKDAVFVKLPVEFQSEPTKERWEPLHEMEIRRGNTMDAFLESIQDKIREAKIYTETQLPLDKQNFQDYLKEADQTLKEGIQRIKGEFEANLAIYKKEQERLREFAKENSTTDLKRQKEEEEDRSDETTLHIHKKQRTSFEGATPKGMCSSPVSTTNGPKSEGGLKKDPPSQKEDSSNENLEEDEEAIIDRLKEKMEEEIKRFTESRKNAVNNERKAYEDNVKIKSHANVVWICPCNIEVVYGDTDSIFVKQLGLTIQEAMKMGRFCAAMLTQLIFRKPGTNNHFINLDWEKAWEILIMYSKKKYCGIMCMFDKDGDIIRKEKYSGIEVSRKDNCTYIPTTMKTCLKMIFERGQQGVKDSLVYARERIRLLRTGRISWDELIISCALKKPIISYVNPTCSSTLAQKINERAKHEVILPGARMKAVIIKSDTKSKADKVEDPMWAWDHNLSLDMDFYLNNAFRKAIVRMYEPILMPHLNPAIKIHKKILDSEIGKELFRGHHMNHIKITYDESSDFMSNFEKKEKCVCCGETLPEIQTNNLQRGDVSKNDDASLPPHVTEQEQKIVSKVCAKCRNSVDYDEKLRVIKKDLLGYYADKSIYNATCDSCVGNDYYLPIHCKSDGCKTLWKQKLLDRDILELETKYHNMTCA